MTLVDIDTIKVGERHRQDLGDLEPLKESIKTIGLMHPVVVTADMRLLAGQRRLEALRELGSDKVPVTVAADLEGAAAYLMAERDENTCRKDMAASELYSLGKALEELERPKAEERRKEGSARGGRAEGSDPSNTTLKTRDVVAPAVGLSGPQWGRLKHIGERATDGDPIAATTLDAIDRGEESISGGYLRLRQDTKKRTRDTSANRAQQIRELAGQGHRISQIADKLKVSEGYVRNLVYEHDIEVPDAVIGKTRHPNAERIVSTTVSELEGTRIALDVIDWETTTFDPEQVEGWVASLNESMRALRKLIRKLQGGN